MDKTKLVDIFYIAGEFCKQVDQYLQHKNLPQDGKRHCKRKAQMSDSEVMTILIMFHHSRTHDLELFYLHYVGRHCQSEFLKQFSYNHFAEGQ